MALWYNFPMYRLISPSLASLMFTNLAIIALAVKQNWSLPELLWIYWAQSVIIGLFNFFKILFLKDFSSSGFYMNKKALKNSTAGKIGVAFFFAVHYGFFHFVYAIFLLVFSMKAAISLKWIFYSAIIYFLNHLFSFIYNFKSDTENQNIGRVMMFPYARIIPMHLTIIFGGIFMMSEEPASNGLINYFPLIFFLALKTASDLIMHFMEHRGPKSSSVPEINI